MSMRRIGGGWDVEENGPTKMIANHTSSELCVCLSVSMSPAKKSAAVISMRLSDSTVSPSSKKILPVASLQMEDWELSLIPHS